MKLVRYGKVGEEKPGLIDENGSLWDLSAHISILTVTIDDATIRRLRSLDKSLSPVAGAPRLGVCFWSWEIYLYWSELLRPCT